MLGVVGLTGEGELTGAEAHLVSAVTGHVPADVPGIPHAVDVADLIAVIGRDRYLDNPLDGLEELDDHLGVEVEAVVVAVERHVAQSSDGVRRYPECHSEKDAPAKTFSTVVRMRLPTNL
jgi:hypothetical protein